MASKLPFLTLDSCEEDHINPAAKEIFCVIEINQESNLVKVTMDGTEVLSSPLHDEGSDEID